MAGRLALVAWSPGSMAAAERLRAGLAGGGEGPAGGAAGELAVDLWVPAHRAAGAPPGALVFDGPLSEAVGPWWERYTGFIFFLAVGAVVRLIAPHLRDKHCDPAVVAIDDRCRFAVPVVSGHVGGANDLARRVGDLLGALPVITTASDLHGTIAVDLLGRQFGFTIPGWRNVTRVSAALVAGEPVALYQDAGEAGWWPGPLPANVHPVASLDTCAAFGAALVITDRTDLPPVVADQAVLYRPRSLVVGVGCNRGTSAAEITGAVAAVLAQYHLAPEAVRNWASIDLKADEPGLLTAAGDLAIDWFDRTALNGVAVPNPSATVQAHVGAQGVAEPAALLSAGPGAALIVPKQKRGNCTVAVARIQFERRDA